MFSIFTTWTMKPFKPVLSPLQPRMPCSSICDEQDQSSFFSMLPAEIRNEIYGYAFTSEAREEVSLEPHPLSLLLTCHKSYHEASILAFRQYTFPVSANLDLNMFISMRNAIAHLSSPQTHAITSLSRNLRRNYTDCHQDAGTTSIIANAILLFPNLNLFELHILRGRKESYIIHDNTPAVGEDSHVYGDVRRDAVQKYAPRWFQTSLLWHLTQGKAYAWQADEHWKIEWPQLVDATYLGALENCETNGGQFLEPFMSTETIGNVRGVHMCPCGCGNIEWTSADIVQETGRRVAIDTIYYGSEGIQQPKLDRNMLLKVQRGLKAVILTEGAPPFEILDGPNCFTSSGLRNYTHEPDEEYWESMRRRNGNLGAIWRGVCKDLTSKTTKDMFPGSMSLNEGDWPRMNELSKMGAVEAVEVIDEAYGRGENLTAKKDMESHVTWVACHDDDVVLVTMT